MRKFELGVETFLNVLRKYTGATPVISIDFIAEKIIVVDAPSGFIKLLFSDDRVIAHLTREGLVVEYFK